MGAIGRAQFELPVELPERAAQLATSAKS
jgi:hypothetical protein